MWFWMWVLTVDSVVVCVDVAWVVDLWVTWVNPACWQEHFCHLGHRGSTSILGFFTFICMVFQPEFYEIHNLQDDMHVIPSTRLPVIITDVQVTLG